jgi:PKD repeat protein
VSYHWDYGDGSIGVDETLAHTYQANGVYIATLTVTDDEGGTSSDTITVHVNNIDNNNQANAIPGQKGAKGYLNNSGQYVVILQCPADLLIINLENQKIGLFNKSQIQ